MPRPRVDISGQRFGKLQVIEYVGGRDAAYLCRCDCGETIITRGDRLRSAQITKCGCPRRRTPQRHGKTGTKAYRSWERMKHRCYNPKATCYHDYGGRGITVCDRWCDSFENFYEDMGDPPQNKHSLDRIDNSGNYSPENCRWATRSEQSRNTRSNRMLTFQGETFCVVEWAERTGVKESLLRGRIKNGWSVERALTEPIRK